jgi:hypothetical protein
MDDHHFSYITKLGKKPQAMFPQLFQVAWMATCVGIS